MIRRMGRCRLLFVAAIATTAVVGCSQGNEAELEQARADAQQAKAEVEQMRKQLESLGLKPSASVSPTASTTLPSATPTSSTSAARRPTVTESKTAAVGTVRLQISGGYSSSMFDMQQGPWVYVDGRLVRDLGTDRGIDADLLSLLPGEYLIEVMKPGYVDTGDGKFPFHLTIRGQRAVVKAGEQSNVRIDFPTLTNPSPWAGALAVPPNGNARGWAAFWQSKAEQQIALYDADPLVEALRRLDAELGDRRPERRLGWLNIPEVHGGRREVNAAIVRVLVSWLKEYYWHVWPPDFTYRTDVTYEGDPEAELQAIRFTEQLVKRHKEQIEQLNSVARKLEMGKE